MTAANTTSATQEELKTALTQTKRLEALYRIKILDTPPENIFDKMTEILCRDLNVPISLVSIVEVERQFFKSQQGLPEDLGRETPIGHSVCQYVVEKGTVLAVDDLRKDPNFQNHPALEFDVVAYLGAPIVYEGEVLGSICAIDTKPHEWTDKDITLIENKANFINAELYLRKKIGKDYSGDK